MRKARYLASGAALIAGLGVVALADVASAQDNTIETVVVTAERRVQDLQTAAVSATVLNEETLEAKGVVNLTSLQYAAPGVQISDYSSANTFNIRGIGQSSVEIDLPSGVVIYRDGVPTLTGYFQNAPYYDMAGVEVLRGPQGTFGGKSAAAGALFIRTRDPELGDFGGSVKVGFGNYDFFQATAIVNLPISDSLAFRAAYHREVRSSLFESIRSNPLPGNDFYGGPFQGDDDRSLHSFRIGLLWRPTEAFDAVWKVDVDHLDFGSHATSGFLLVAPGDPLMGVEEDIANPIVNGPHDYVDRGVRSSLRLTYELEGGVRINSLTGYSTVKTRANWDFNGSDPNPYAFLSAGRFTNWSQEFNVLSPDDQRFRWVAGLFWQKYKNDLFDGSRDGLEANFADDPPSFISSPWIKDEQWYAVFGQVEFDLTERLELQVGGRWGHYEFDQFTQWVLFEDPNIPFLQPVGGIREDFEEDAFDWKVNLGYRLSDTQFVYGLVSRGHTPGSINAGPNVETLATGRHTAFEQMEVINYELGWKGLFLDRRVQTQANAYYQTFENYQAAFALVGVGIPNIDTVSEFKNAEALSTIYGIEIGAQIAIDNWSVDAGFAYSKSELGSFGTVLNPFAPVFGGPTSINLDGARTPFAPEVTANAGVAYTFELAGDQFGSGATLTPRIDVAYRSDSYASLFRNRATLLQGQTLLNASVRFESGDWTLTVWGTNLTDERYPAAKQSVTGINGFIEGIVYMAPPRLFGVRLERDF